ncbi:MAG: Maf family protein [Actinomycetota bacterium]|nr:Maf family protein [Actinomycetota bacterium]
MKLVLASGSPRRKALLQQLGLAFDVLPSDVDESRHPHESPADYVERLAVEKATAVAAENQIVIAADTIVVHEGKILGKPAHPEEARGMLRRLQGADHDVFTGLAVAGWDGGPTMHRLTDVTEVRLIPMTDDEIADYVDTGEPMDKAGAYALQGMGGRFVESVRGSSYTVIGLPIHRIAGLLTHAGTDIREFLV